MRKRYTVLAATAGSVLLGALALPAAAQPAVAPPPGGPLAERAAAFAALSGEEPGPLSDPLPEAEPAAGTTDPLPEPGPDAGTGPPEPAPVPEPEPEPEPEAETVTDAADDPAAAPRAAVTADALRAALGRCTQISQGKYRTDRTAPADVPVCGRDGIVHWTADLDVDCDGRETAKCNRRTDPYFQPMTAFQQSDGRYLNAEELPFVVVPVASDRWNYWASGIRGGTVAAMVHKDRVVYGVVGDSGPADVIGEASYAAAEALGIDPHPTRGGTAEDVTYILFPGTRATPIESRSAAESLGEDLARKLVGAVDDPS
ncbi:glycoside hydrolase family 75 protein [Streptomyces sp. NPDC005805]|uniref:glycoside hydrolase family 75 protein n=1 Tax=Streptomyces sp. NPDC005805 TaxID=3157068 RepID=UPI0034069981